MPLLCGVVVVGVVAVRVGVVIVCTVVVPCGVVTVRVVTVCGVVVVGLTSWPPLPAIASSWASCASVIGTSRLEVATRLGAVERRGDVVDDRPGA